MKKPADNTPEDLLLEAVLADDHWNGLELDLKAHALRVLETRRRRRQRLWRGAQSLVLGLVCAGAAIWWQAKPGREAASATQPAPNATAAVAAPRTEAQPLFVSEEEMLALFPEGSCVLAEVGGAKQLVFLDARAAREGFVLPR